MITPEMAAARAFTKHINVLDFNVDAFAAVFARGGTAIQKRYFNVFLGLCRYWARQVDNGAVDESDGSFYSMCIYSKRILDITPEEIS